MGCIPPPYSSKKYCSKEVRRLEISQLLPRDSSLHDRECRKHSAISPSRRLGHFHRSCGCLFPYTHPQRLPKISSISDSGQNIPIPGTAIWPFSSTLGYSPEIKMLVHMMGINLCQYYCSIFQGHLRAAKKCKILTLCLFLSEFSALLKIQTLCGDLCIGVTNN